MLICLQIIVYEKFTQEIHSLSLLHIYLREKERKALLELRTTGKFTAKYHFSIYFILNTHGIENYN